MKNLNNLIINHNYIVIDQKDNVMIALADLEKGMVINNVTLLEDIKIGHKISLKDIQKGENIIKYGYPIGSAKEDIKKGGWVHVHNVKTNLSDVVEYQFNQVEFAMLGDANEKKKRLVNIYKRENGDVGIRNEIWVIPTVGCVSGQVKQMVELFNQKHPILDVDGVYTFTHPYGCSQMGDDGVNTLKSLVNMIKHPNAGGVLVVGLGCENTQIAKVKEELKTWNNDRIKFLTIQDEEDEIHSGLELLEEIYQFVKNDKRTKESIEHIKIGLECGGSDGLSGITANPLIGRVSDRLIAYGGTSVLTEVPEMFGAEQILLNQCESKEVYEKLVNLVNGFKNYYKKHDQVIYENPSPGNKNGGITTLEDKSLGCIRKAGSTPVVDVLEMTDLIDKKGLNIISSPGNDLVATTILGMCGCQLVLFSTGRGTPFGGFVPTIKVSTNSRLAKNKPNWIDFNSGDINEGNSEKTLDAFFDLIVDIIEGKKTKNEINKFREIAIFKSGVTL